MTAGAIQTFSSYSGTLSLIGLIFDMMGALILLGPELPGMARAMTTVERRYLDWVFERFKKRGFLDQHNLGFATFVDMLRQSPDIRETWKPYQEEPPVRISDFSRIETSIDGDTAYLEAETEDGSRTIRASLQTVETWIQNYTGSARQYFRNGGVLLFSGFFFQFTSQLSNSNPDIATATFLIGGVVILLVIRKYL